MLKSIVVCVLVVFAAAIQVPSSWKDEQVFLPYYTVVDGSPSNENPQTYYPENVFAIGIGDQVVQNDEAIKLFQKMNPTLTILQPKIQLDSKDSLAKNNQQNSKEIPYALQPTYHKFVPISSQSSNNISQYPNVNNELNDKYKRLSLNLNEITSSKITNQNLKETKKDEVNPENPGDIPTKPIHPGSKRSSKHHPHVTKNVRKEDNDETPSPGINFYNLQKQKFQKEFKNFPEKHNLRPIKSSSQIHEEASPDIFVPSRTYAQVRHSESKKHVPKKYSDDPKLRKSINDSKIYTIYTEEGYEDSAYDHGGQEKNAESKENYHNKEKKSSGEEQKENIENDDLYKDFEIPETPSPPPFEENDESESDNEDSSDEEDKNANDSRDMEHVHVRRNNLTNHQKKEEKEKTRVEDETGSDELGDNEKEQSENNKDEEAIIDSIMEETSYGKKVTLKHKPYKSVTESKRRLRRFVETNGKRQMDEKYPYYNAKEVDSLSSLRYAENPKNIPKKSGKGVMSFYDKADKIECSKITDVDPVPQRVKNADGNFERENETESPHPMKLGNLGDRIDCLKARYFGEDPFDNPLFKEEEIDSPSSIFKERSSINEIKDSEEDTSRLGKDFDDAKNITEDLLPEAQPYILRIYRRPPYRYHKRNKTYSKPHRQHNQKPNLATRTPQQKPSSQRISEVHYKDEIKPSEQMNVFADIINNIKNSSRDPELAPSDIQPVSIKVSLMKKTPQRNRIQATFQGENPEIKVYRRSTTPTPFYYTSANYNKISDEVPKRYRKRRRRPQATTEQEMIQHTTEYVKVKKQIIQPDYSNSNEVLYNLNPGNFDDFNPVLRETERINHKPEYHEIDTSAVNKFYVVGMRPPPEKPYIHPNYRMQNKTPTKRRRTIYPVRKRIARSTRHGYSEIRSRQTTTEKVENVEEKEDDYVPHRNRNFHYDEKTGRIIYDKKPEEEVEEEIEYEYVEVEEPTHPPPKKEQRRIWPSKFPDGLNYLDFIKKLKDDPSYTAITDPEPTEKPIEVTTAELQSTSSASSTGLPEFLAILNKVRSDETYKFIEDPTKKPKATTPKDLVDDIEEIADDVSEESRQRDVQNSPGVQGLRNVEFENSDTSDFMSKTKTYSVRTGIDTSKYKSIERTPNTRHRISSKYNAEESSNVDVDSPPITQATTTVESLTIDIPTSSIPATTPFLTTTEKLVAVTKTKRVLLSRRRSTTPVPRETITKAPTVNRQRGRSRFRTSVTTEAPKQPITRSRRNLQRRNSIITTVPKNHKPQYVETQTLNVIKPTPRTITLNLLKQTNGTNFGRKTNNANNSAEKNKTQSDDVDVFKNFDKTQKHGGNFKYKKVEIKITRNYKPLPKGNEDSFPDTVRKSFSYYSDEKLPVHVNRLKENNFDSAETAFGEDDSSTEKEDDFFEDVVEQKTKKQSVPTYIKDPSKRLYYYAPI